MPSTIASPVSEPPNSTFSCLPRGIQDKILFHLLVSASPIDVDRANVLKSDSQDVQHSLLVIDLLPQACEIFYRYNIFYVFYDNDLQSFLDCKPSAAAINGKRSTPKDNISHLIISMQPHLQTPSDDTMRAMHSLLDCPKLKMVEIKIHAFYECHSEFDRTFYKIADVCAKLGDRLGEEGLKVDLLWLYDTAVWTVADFKSGVPPKSYNR